MIRALELIYRSGVEFAYAQAAASPSPVAVPVVEAVNKAADAIPTALPVFVAVGVGLAAELIVRMWPTAKPKSFLLVGSALFKAIAGVFEKSSGLLDKVAQNVKEK